MKKMRKLMMLLLFWSLALNVNVWNVKAEENVSLTNDEYLRETGMPENEMQKLDSNVKQFIVDDLKSGSGNFEYIKTDVEEQAVGRSAEVLSGITFYASAFKNGSTIYVYPTYEFTTNKRPRGKDSFSFSLGDAMRPYEFGGKLWYKDSTMNDWAVGGTLVANNQNLNGAEYSGSQLGTPDYAMKLKGVTYCHATVGSGNDKRIVMGYLYNPNKTNYSVSFSYAGAGISYSPEGVAYSKFQINNLTY